MTTCLRNVTNDLALRSRTWASKKEPVIVFSPKATACLGRFALSFFPHYDSIPKACKACSVQPAASISTRARPREPWASEPGGEAPSRCQGVTDRLLLPLQRDDAAGQFQSTLLCGLPHPRKKSRPPRPLALKFGEETGLRGKPCANPYPRRCSVCVPGVAGKFKFWFPPGSLAAA